MKCPYCGKEVEEGSKFCDGCGAKLDNNPVKSEETVYYAPKKSKTGLIVAIIIICVLLIAGIIVGVILLNKGDKKDNNKDNNNSSIKTEDDKKGNLISNVKHSEEVLDNGDILVLIENKNSKEVSFSVEVDYYDAEGTKIDSNTDSVVGLPGNEKTVLRIRHSDREYKEYELHFEEMNSAYYKSYNKDITITSKENKEDEEIVVTLKNGSSSKLDSVKVAALFYKDGKIVGYSYDSEYDVDANEAIALYIDYPYDKNYDNIEFDTYEVYLIEAIAYNF